MKRHRKTRNRVADSPFSPARLGEKLLWFRASFPRFHKPLEIRVDFRCFRQLFSAFIPPARKNLCPVALLTAVSAAAAYGIELDASRPVAEERPLLPCVLFHILSPSFFLLNPKSSIPIHPIYPIYPRGCLGWIGMDVFHIRELLERSAPGYPRSC